MRDKYGVAHDKYCYPNSDVLINLLGIRDSDTLDEAEAEFTAERYRTYEPSQQTLCDFSFEHLKHLHHHLFQDLYAWAGETRDVDISKGDTRFCTWTRIEPEAQKLFRTIPALADYQDNDELIEKVADLFCELNLLHPFREGNGRVLRFFFEEMLYTLGYDVTWPKISQQDWIDANIAGVHLNLDLLKVIFSQAISEL
ncbi:Fic family protein [Pseudoalteromonas sp. KG3]|jgi:cell filamentation protein|uniref:protein adenylyltransferase n=1 Tax=Pseudoalteromonas prydzensis TaxID=182141 RepID=A0ABR9FIS2_9GAMM|nr:MULTISPECIES: Fic family protein [Pseudoalteromonas]MBE0456731.1 Fic family protein [Pseudoalteromonas prydzensis]WKD22818.1 Fic family protein [Pseudoalteromonas sp. KG3]